MAPTACVSENILSTRCLPFPTTARPFTHLGYSISAPLVLFFGRMIHASFSKHSLLVYYSQINEADTQVNEIMVQPNSVLISASDDGDEDVTVRTGVDDQLTVLC